MTPWSQEVEDYVKDRGKPKPSFNHGVVQAKLIIALNVACRDRFLIASELSLATEPPMTPDISICRVRKPDRLHDERRAEEAPLSTVEIVSPSQSISDFVPRI